MAELDLTQMHTDLHAEIERSVAEDAKHDKAIADETKRATAAEADNATEITELGARIDNIVTPNGQASLQEVVDARMRKDATEAEASLKARLDKDQTASTISDLFPGGVAIEELNAIKKIEVQATRDFIDEHPLPWYISALKRRHYDSFADHYIHVISFTDSNSVQFHVLNTVSDNFAEPNIFTASIDDTDFLLVVKWDEVPDGFGRENARNPYGKINSNCIKMKPKTTSEVFPEGVKYPAFAAIKSLNINVTKQFVDTYQMPWCINTIRRNASLGDGHPNVHSIEIRAANGFTFNILNVLSSEFDEAKEIKIKVYGENVDGFAYVDWDMIDPGTSIYDSSHKSRISTDCVTVFDVNSNAWRRYPFEEPFFKVDNHPGASAIKYVRIEHCIPDAVTLSVVDILKHDYNQSNGLYVAAILIKASDINGTTVHRVTALNVDDSKYDYREINTFRTDKIRGTIIINWEELPESYKSFNAFVINGSCVHAMTEVEYNLSDKATLDLFVPKTIYGVQGRPTYLRHWNMTKYIGNDRGSIMCSPARYQFQNQGDRFKVNPNSGETMDVTIRASNSLYVNPIIKTTTVVGVSDNPEVFINAIFIGDSITEIAQYIAELTNMLPNMKTNGTRLTYALDADDNKREIHHEGRSSWQAYEYVTKSEKKGTRNSFWNETTSKFDFSKYMTESGTEYGTLTDVFILLGTNDTFSIESNTKCVDSMKEIVESIKLFNENIKIHIILPPPNIDDGYAWGVRNNYHNQYWKNSMFDLWKMQAEAFQDLDVIPAGLNVDCWYDYPKMEIAVNERNPEKIVVGNENVHPNRYGMYNISDVIYAHIMATR